jgi:VanZ family protein
VRPFLFLIAALLVYGSLFPWQFTWPPPAGDPLATLVRGWPAEWNYYVARDCVLNVVIYSPLGLAAAFTFRRRHSRAAAAALAVAFGFLFSVSMELLQSLVPPRCPSLLDVLTNCIGCAAGAAFAMYFEAPLRQVSQRRAGPLRLASVLLLLVWAVSELYPFLPAVGRSHFREQWMRFWPPRNFSLLDAWIYCAEWFAVGLAIETVFARMETLWLLLAMFCVPAQLLIVERKFTSAEVAGSLAALALWRLAPPAARPRWCGWMLGSAILLRELYPLNFAGTPQPFAWIPFKATLVSSRDMGAIAIARKAFDYGAAIWSLRYIGIPYLWAGLAVAVTLGACEAIQTYLPGRTPEITDPLLALLMLLVLRAICRPASGAA